MQCDYGFFSSIGTRPWHFNYLKAICRHTSFFSSFLLVLFLLFVFHLLFNICINFYEEDVHTVQYTTNTILTRYIKWLNGFLHLQWSDALSQYHENENPIKPKPFSKSRLQKMITSFKYYLENVNKIQKKKNYNPQYYD